MHQREQTVPFESDSGVRGPLDADAANFLAQFGAALALPAEAVDDETASARYLDGERNRLGAPAGVSLLNDAQRAIRTEDHVLREGVEVRSYLPAGRSDAERPIALFIHGGGWATGTIDLHDSTCRILAEAGDMVIINVGYRLAPEHPYPAPLDDCDRALQWARSVARERFGADPARLAVIGASSGGNLAAALALRARDRAPSDGTAGEIALQVLIYPALDAQMATESYDPHVNGRDYFISAQHMRWYWDLYRRGTDVADDDPYFSPLAASDLSGLPPAVIISAEFDLLRDDAIRFHARLRAAGVPSERRHRQQIHGFMAFLDVIEEAYAEVEGLARHIRTRLDSLEPARLAHAESPAIDVAARVEPGTLEALDGFTRWDTTSIETIRASYAALPRRAFAPAEGVTRTEGVVTADDGREIPVRWYRPAGVSEPVPTVVYFHGGAYIMGTLDENDERLDEFVRNVGCAVVSVDYRLAPEHPYPAGLDDAETVWRALADEPQRYGIDPGRLAVAGGSAGAGLAAALCLRLAERGRAQPCYQLLVYPMLDDRELPSVRALDAGAGHWGLWRLAAERLSWAAYLGDDTGRATLPASAVPGRADVHQLRGLAPAFIGVGDVDALVDSNIRYAAMLIEAGVPTEFHIYPGVIHGGFLPRPATPGTKRFLADAYDALRRAFLPL